jgi:hypothetical protein
VHHKCLSCSIFGVPGRLRLPTHLCQMALEEGQHGYVMHEVCPSTDVQTPMSNSKTCASCPWKKASSCSTGLWHKHSAK